MGFLYLRYTCDPEKLWGWYEPYLDDKEEFNAAANPNVKTYVDAQQTHGQMRPCVGELI